MALKIVTGGTTGAADGTLVSSGNPLVIVTLNTAVDCHIRCDDGYWSNDQDFDVPAELEVSFDGGSTWYDNGDEPITAPEIYAVNVPIKIRQTVAAASTSGSFVTDGTYTAISALSTPTLTATVISDSQIDLSWTNVANEDASPGYTLQRGTDGITYGTTVTTTAQNVTTHSDTGLTASTHYYYRVKAEGSGRYSDSSYGTDDDTTDALFGNSIIDTLTGASWDSTNNTLDPTGGGRDTAPTAYNGVGIGTTSSGFAWDFWRNTGTYGPDPTECHIEIPTAGAGNITRVYARMQSPNTSSATLDAYMVQGTPGGSTVCLRLDNSVTGATLGSWTASASATGFGIRCTGTGATVTVTAWERIGGVWTLVQTYTDTSGGRITAAGYIGALGIDTAGASRWKNFGGS